MMNNVVTRLFGVAAICGTLGACTTDKSAMELQVSSELLKTRDRGAQAIGLALAEGASSRVASAGSQVRTTMAGNGGRDCDVSKRRDPKTGQVFTVVKGCSMVQGPQ